MRSATFANGCHRMDRDKIAASNPYLVQIERVLPRLLSLYNRDPISPTLGQGDRLRWAWKLVDFGNGTFQSTAHGLARLLHAGLLPEGLSETSILARITEMFQGAAALRRSNGSLEEALPYESSFCVTALVAFDLLTAVELLGDRLPRASYLEIVGPMIRFLSWADEHHAFISNHLATAAAALFKWQVLTGEPTEQRGRIFLDRILAAQSREGWFREYQGADPGYETLGLYFLADIHQLRPDARLHEALCRSVRFLCHFVHPDGSFGGLYGSRNTRFYYPAGIEMLAGSCPEAAAMARHMRRAIGQHAVVTLDALDAPNLAPMFNAYCWAASLLHQRTANEDASPELPWGGPGAGPGVF
jgi:hypothetical protein